MWRRGREEGSRRGREEGSRKGRTAGPTNKKFRERNTVIEGGIQITIRQR
jgi:hypothetical protein